MNITITGSLGNIGRPLTQLLVAQGHRVTLVTRDHAKKKLIEDLNAIAAVGSVDDRDFLTRSFENADTVFTMIPPAMDSANLKKSLITVAQNFTAALTAAGVTHVVNLSGIGAHLGEGHGPSGLYKFVEEELNQLAAAHVVHLRGGMFYTNYYGNMELIRQQGIVGNNFEGNIPIVMSHPKDIAITAAGLLGTADFTGKTARYATSDERSGDDVAAILGREIQLPGLPWVRFPDESLMSELVKAGVSTEMAGHFVDMGIAIRNGSLFSDYYQHPPTQQGALKFETFAKEFAAVYQQQPILQENN